MFGCNNTANPLISHCEGDTYADVYDFQCDYENYECSSDVLPPPPSGPCAGFDPADLNGDGEISAIDVVILTALVTGQADDMSDQTATAPDGCEVLPGDIDGNGLLELMDINLLTQLIVG